MDSSIFDPDLSTESGREQMEADYCHEPPPTQVNQAEGAAGDEDDEGDYEGWEEAMEAIEGLPIYDPDASYGSNPAPECKTPPDASFGPGEEEADETMGDPSKLSSIGGFFSDSEEEPEPLHSPQYYEKKEYQDAEEEPEEQEELQDAEEEPEEQEELQDGEEEPEGLEELQEAKAEEGQDSEEESDEEPDEVGQPDDKVDLDEEKLEAYFEAADAELAAQIDAQQAAEAEAGGKELMRQLSGGGKSKKRGAALLVRAPDSSSREPDFEEEDDEPVVSKEQVVFEKLPPKRAGGRYLLSFQGYKYSVSKPAKEDQAKEKQRWRMRCSSHGGGRGGTTKCRVSFFVDGNDQMLDEPVKVFHHTCGRPDAKEVCREKIRGQIRELVAKAFEEGHYYRFSNEVKKIFRRLTDRELRLAEWTLLDLVRYAYTHSRWKLSLPNPPSDFYFSWPDQTNFLMRDPGHEGTKHNILLWDSGVFQFKTKRQVDKDGRILVLGEDYIRRYVERGLVDGALIDGTYACAPKGFSQLFNVLFRVVLKRDAAGKPCKVAWIHGVSACLTSHDYGIYHRFFQWLKDWIGDWNPSYVASDYEIAATAAFRAVWANVCQISCRFHLSKGIRDRITKQGFMQEFIADARSRRMLRFLMAVAYVPTEELAREVLEKFLVTVKPKSEAEAQKPFFTDILPYLQKTFIGILVKPSVPASEGKDAVPAVWKKPRYALKSWLRHQPALNSWPTTTNAIESFHRMIKRSSCPNPGLWNLLDLMGHVLELNRGRLRVIDSLLEKESEAKDLDGMFDAYGVDFDVTEMEEDGFKDGGEGPVEFAEHSPVKVHQKKLNKKVRWVNGSSETSASVLKDNPVALEYVSARVGAVERLSSGYLPLEVARRDMDQPFSCLEEGVRKWLAYQDSSDLRYLYVRKMACLISGFGVPKAFRMSRRESKLFRDTFSKWSAYEANLVVEEDDDAEEECSDTEGVAVEANAELKSKERRDSMAAGLIQSVPVVEGEEELAVDETGPAAEAKSKGGKAKSKDGKAKSKGGKGSAADKAPKLAVGTKVGGKAGGASGKGSGADKAAKPAVGSKVGGKAGGASGKGSGADKAAKPAVGSKVGGKAGGASGKGSSVKRSSLKAGQKFDSTKTDKLASSSTKNGSDEASDSEGERPLASLKRVSGERKVGVSPKALRMGNDPGAGTSAEGVVADEADGDAEDVAEVQAPKDKKKRRKKSFTRYSPKNLRSKSKLM